MNAGRWIRFAGMALSVAVALALFVAIPSSKWTTSSVIAAVMLTLSIAFPVIAPPPLPRAGRDNDAAAVFALGALGTLSTVLLATSGFALWRALEGATTTASVLNVLWAGLAIAGWAVTRGSADVVSAAAAQTRTSSADPRTEWIGRLRSEAARIGSGSVLQTVDSLAERIRFAANEGTAPAAQNESISSLLNEFSGIADKPELLAQWVRTFESQLDQREHFIRSMRSKA
jgi:hypothetical protein